MEMGCENSSLMTYIFDYIDSHTDEMLECLRELMRIPSVAVKGEGGFPFGEESAKALGCLKAMSEAFGLRTREFANYAVTADYGSGEVGLGILAHADVVPEGEGWTKPCFDLTVEDGRVYGRGAIDDKGPAVASLFAAKAIESSGIKLSKAVRYIFGGGEELGCEDLAYYASCERLPDNLITPDGEFPIVNAEKGMVHFRAEMVRTPAASDKLISLRSGCAVNAVPAKAIAVLKGVSMDEILEAVSSADASVKYTLEQKGTETVITAAGKSAHGSRPELGINALTALAGVLADLNIEPCDLLSGLFPFGCDNGEGFGLELSDEQSGKLTLALTVCSIADSRIEIGCDCRFPVSARLDDVVPVIEKLLREKDFELTETEMMEPHYVDENSDFIRSLKKAYQSAANEEARCLCETGVTYVHNTDSGVAFGAEMRGENNGMHGADESISIERLKLVAKVYAAAIVEICG